MSCDLPLRRATWGSGVLALTIGLCASPIRGAEAPQRAVPLQGLPHADFARMPGTALIAFEGRTMTKSQLLIELGNRSREAQSRASRLSSSSLQAFKVKFTEDEKARMMAKNAQVSASLAKLKASGPAVLHAADPSAKPKPVIREISPSSSVEPEQVLIINGRSFGEPKSWGAAGGEVLLEGGFPGGSLKLRVDAWSDEAIAAVVPYVSGVEDHATTLVINPTGQNRPKSDPYPVEFKATRVVESLAYHAVNRQGPNGPHDKCSPGQATIECWHGFWDWDVNGDYLSVHLKRGWRFQDYSYHAGLSPRNNTDPVNGFIAPLFTFQPGSADTKASFFWAVELGSVSYSVEYLIVGPQGIPYR